jgi:hypothetical protein
MLKYLQAITAENIISYPFKRGSKIFFYFVSGWLKLYFFATLDLNL